MKALLPWATSLVTLWGMWAIGNKKWWGWLIGLVNQVLWVSFTVAFAAWGLLPLTGALIVIYTRNLLRWKQEAAEDRSTEPNFERPSGPIPDSPTLAAMLREWSDRKEAELSQGLAGGDLFPKTAPPFELS